jgi:DNA-binding MarR family transcriptional regulator
VDSVDRELADWLAVMGPGVDPDVEAARQRIGRLSRQFEQVLTEVAAAHDMTVGDWAALSVLRRSGPVCTPKQLAETLNLTSGTVSVRLDRLVRAGLVEHVAAADGRSRPVRLTRKGRARWRTATAARTARERELFGDVDLTALNPLLAALLGRFEDAFGAVSRHDQVR